MTVKMTGKRLELRQILILALLLLLVLQLLMVGIYSSYGMLIVREREQGALSYIQNMYCANLESALEEAEQDLRELLSEREEFWQMKNSSSLKRWQAANRLLERLETCRAASERTDAYAILGSGTSGLLIARSANIHYQDLPKITGYLQGELEKEEEDLRWRSVQLNGRGFLVKTYFYYEDVVLAALISEERIVQILTYGQDLRQSDQTTDFYILDAEHRVICCSEQPQQYGIDWQEREEDRQYTYREREVLGGDYYLVCRMRRANLFGQSPLFWLTLVLLVSSVVFLAWYLRFIRREVVLPIVDLSETSEKIRTGDLEVRPSYVSGIRELCELKETYATMLDTILELKVREYEEKLLLKDSELKYLHMQLKPHFFLNALSTINSMAYEEKTEDIRKFVQAFSDNIRYMFRAGLYTVPLSEELDGVSKYLSMQRFLYGESFYTYFQVSDGLQDYPVPQMLLHTFVENIFKHAAGAGEFLDIFVVCSKERHNGQEMLKIEIMDSGKRFPEEIVRKINGDEQTGAAERVPQSVQEDVRVGGRGIGLSHTKNILRIMYEQEGLLHLENESEEGKRVIVWIPGRVREELAAKEGGEK